MKTISHLNYASDAPCWKIYIFLHGTLPKTISKNHSDWLDSEIDNRVWGIFRFGFDFWSSLGFWKSAILFTVESQYKNIRYEFVSTKINDGKIFLDEKKIIFGPLSTVKSQSNCRAVW